ncbi:MAG: hypothetical protein J6M31_03175 [Bacteroidales bacterium]|nr:hypothetical protein [Bacteroidales bacterium]
MKDLVISGKTLRRELWVVSGCLVAGALVNVVAVIGYHRPWTELFTQLGYVVVLSIGVYFVLALVRLLIFLILLIIRKFHKL